MFVELLLILRKPNHAPRDANVKSDDFEVWSNKGFAHCKLGGFEDAIGVFEKAIDTLPIPLLQ